MRICSTRVLSGLGFTKPHGVMSEASPSEAKLAGSSPARVMLMPSLAAVVPHEAPGQCHDLFLELVILSFQSLTVVNVCQQFLFKSPRSPDFDVNFTSSHGKLKV